MNFRDRQILVRNAIPGRDGVFELQFPTTYTSYGNDSLTLNQLTCYYSWFNVNSDFGNRTFNIVHNGSTYPITLPEGNYEIIDLQGYLELQLVTLGLYLVDENGAHQYYIKMAANTTYNCVTLTMSVVPSSLLAGWTNPGNMVLTGTTMQLMINNAEFGKLIGFPVGSYPSAPQHTIYDVNSPIVPQISPVTSVIVHCNWLSNTEFDSNFDVLGSFTPDVSFGGLITYTPPVPIPSSALGGKYPGIQIRLTDQENRPLKIRDISNILIAISIRTYDKA